LFKTSGSWIAVVSFRRLFMTSVVALGGLFVSGRSLAADAAPAPAGAAAYNDSDDLNLENLLRLKVITASGGVAEESDLAPANVFTILSSEIAAQGWRSVAEVLEHVPGLYVVDDFVTQNVEVRGASSGLRAGTRIMKVMINGTDVSFRADLNALIGPEFIPIDVVERIEIARGPLSALYGANAFLATVNVVTVDPDHVGGKADAHGSARPHSGGTSLGGGVSGVATAKVGEHLKLLLSAGYDHLDRGGLTIKNTYPGQGAATPHLINDNTSGTDLARPVSVFGRLTGTIGGLADVSLQGGLQQSDSNGNFQLGSVMTGLTRESLRNMWLEGQYNQRLTDVVSFSATAGVAHGAPTDNDKMYVTDTFNSYYNRNFSYNAGDGKFTLTLTPRANLRISGGLDTSYEVDHTLFYTQHFVQADAAHMIGDIVEQLPMDGKRTVTVTKIAPNVHASFDPITGMRLSADGRVDFINLFDKQMSARVAAGYRILPKLVAKVIGGRAFQTPSTVFLYAYPGFGTADVIGSRNLTAATTQLVPQTVTSGELVVNYLPNAHVSINGSGYYQVIDNQINFVTTGPNFVARNQGAAKSAGGELNVTGRFGHFEPYGRFSAQKFLNHPNRSAFDTGPVIPPALVPAVWGMVGLRATVPNPHLTFDATWRGVGERGASGSNIFFNSGRSYALPAYQQFDLAGTFTVSALGKGHDTRMMFAVRNLLDERHSEPGFGGIDIPTMGRTFQLGLSQSY
jgi:outer membrane receptor protein involved in Fe transport